MIPNFKNSFGVTALFALFCFSNLAFSCNPTKELNKAKNPNAVLVNMEGDTLKKVVKTAAEWKKNPISN